MPRADSSSRPPRAGSARPPVGAARSRRDRAAARPAPADRRSPCPVACTLDLVGDRWSLLIIRDLACGKSHFKDFAASPEKIATNILADRLNRLAVARLIQKFPSPEDPRRGAYRLTDTGRSLLTVLDSLARWGLEHIPGTEARLKPIM